MAINYTFFISTISKQRTTNNEQRTLMNIPTNLMLTVTNVFAVFPLYEAGVAGDYTTLYVILFTALMSTASHLVQNHKHGQKGIIRVSEDTSRALNTLDVIGCALVAARVGWLYCTYIGMSATLPLFLVILSCIVNIGSDIALQSGSTTDAILMFGSTQNAFAIMHSMWHMSAYVGLALTLQCIYRSASAQL